MKLGCRVLDGGAVELEEALRLSLLPPEEREEEVEEEGGKRKLEDRGQTPQAKRRRLGNTEEEEEEEDEEEDEEGPVEDVYKPGGEEGWSVKHPQFPSILELLDIDIPVVETLVKDR